MSDKELAVGDKIVIHDYNIVGVDQIFIVKNFEKKNDRIYMVVYSQDNKNYEISLQQETDGLWNLENSKDNVNKNLTIHFLGGDPQFLPLPLISMIVIQL